MIHQCVCELYLEAKMLTVCNKGEDLLSGGSLLSHRAFGESGGSPPYSEDRPVSDGAGASLQAPERRGLGAYAGKRPSIPAG